MRVSPLRVLRLPVDWFMLFAAKLTQRAPVAQPVEAMAPEAVSDSPFDLAIHGYAEAVWHHDMAGMRAGYTALQDLFTSARTAGRREALEEAAKACNNVIAEHGGDPAGRLLSNDRDTLIRQCQAAGASQCLAAIRALPDAQG